MAQKKQALFQWNRKDQLDVVSSHGKKKGSIKDWIQKVQHAAEVATQDALDGELPEFSLKEVIPDDEAVYEAQELVNGWMRETSLSNIENELEYRNEKWAPSTNNSLFHKNVDMDLDYNDNSKLLDEIQKKYLCGDVANIDYDVDTHKTGDMFSSSSGHFSSLVNIGDDDDDDIDDALLVQDVLHGMLSRDFQKHVDLGMKPLALKAKNPVPKMDIRHEQVKRKGEWRRRKNIEKKKVEIDQKDIAQKAKERVVFEERQRIAREKAEEKAILSEMEKIKLELAEEKQKQQEEIEKKERILHEAKLQMQIELKREREQELQRRKEEDEVRFHIQKEMEEEALLELQTRMKILHKYLSAWYNVVLQQRLKLGKAQAIAEWKCKVRAWNAWRAYVCCVKTNQEAKAIEQTMKEKYRKEQMAVGHAKKNLLCKCFISWLKYTRYKSEKALLKLEREETSKKMALFLEAASTGQLWEKKSEESMQSKSDYVDRLEFNNIEEQNTGEESCTSVSMTVESPHQIINYSKNKKSKADKQVADRNDSRKVAHMRAVHKEDLSKQVADKNDSRKVVCMKAVHKEDSSVGYIPVDQIKLADSREKLTPNDDNGVSGVIQSREIDTAGKIKKETFKGRGTSSGAKFIGERPSDVAGKSITDRSDVSCVSSEVSSVPSRKAKVHSEKQTTKPLHLAMEEREKGRQKRKAAIDAEKRRKDEERLAALKAKEAERLMQEQLEKEEKLKQRQEQKKLEALKQKEKEFQIQQFRVKNTIAKEHYHKVLMRKYGIKPLTCLVQIARLNIQISDKYHHSLLLRFCFVEWHLYVKGVSSAKREKSEEYYEKILKRRAFHSWMKCRFHLQNMNKIARNFSLNRTLKHAFNAWQDYVTDERILMWAKESNAEEHDTTRMMKSCLNSWRSYVKLEKEARERESRKEEFRKKVHLWLPDYKGGFEAT